MILSNVIFTDGESYSLVLAFGELSLDQTNDETNPKTIIYTIIQIIQ